MEKETLHKFFEGTATREEKKAVRTWLTSSPAHERELLKEREFFDAIILSKEKKHVATNRSPGNYFSLPLFIRESFKIVATIAITIACGYYFYTGQMKEIETSYYTMQVPSGQRANIKLPDGTVVWLNAGSEIRYASFFKDSRREVELNGEAYFEVTHNEKQPFVVRTDRYDVEVLGTHFNVEAYTDTDHFSTALIEGSVKVSSREITGDEILLKPDQKVTQIDGKLAVSAIDNYDTYRWREGLICFKNMNFTDLMKLLEKYYEIEIRIENPHLSGHIFSGKFRTNDGVDNALQILQKDITYTYSKNNEGSIIYIK